MAIVVGQDEREWRGLQHRIEHELALVQVLALIAQGPHHAVVGPHEPADLGGNRVTLVSFDDDLASAGLAKVNVRLYGWTDADVLAIQVLADDGTGWASDWAAGVDHVVSVAPDYENLAAINLIDTEDWYDLLGGGVSLAVGARMELAPYQTVWISNLSPD